jgi:cell division protein FtsI/penicillin-binding protein 2
VVHPTTTDTRDLGLTPDQLDAMRRALIAVVEHGTAAASRTADLMVAGKTGTAQNPHGKDHGWFIGFAPADKPQIIVGGIMEFAQHGTVVAPYVVRAIRRYLLGAGDTTRTRIEIVAPEDSAPRALDVPPPPDSLPPDSIQ